MSRPLSLESGGGVFDTEEVEHGGVEVVHFDPVFDGFVAPFVSGAVDGAGFDASSGKPDGVAVLVVVAAILALGKGSAAKLAGFEDNEGVVEHAPLFEVIDKAAMGWSTARALFS